MVRGILLGSLVVILMACAPGAARRGGGSPGRGGDGERAAATVATVVPLPLVFPMRLDGGLTVVAGFEVRAVDARLGGLSGLCMDHGGHHLKAVTDRGHWVHVGLRRGARGVLVGLGPWRIGPLRDLAGWPVQGVWSDAEAVARASGADGGWLVSFEQRHRVWRYAPGLDARPQPVALPPEATAAPANGGIEALTTLRDGRLLLISEDHAWPDGRLRAWIGEADCYSALGYAASEELAPTDLTTLPGGDVVVVERRYRPETGLAIRLQILELDAINEAARQAGGTLQPRTLARLDGRLPVDNFEGLASEERDGRTYLYLVSDDNFSARQKTLIYQLRYEATVLRPTATRLRPCQGSCASNRRNSGARVL